MIVDQFLQFPVEDWYELQAAMIDTNVRSPKELAQWLYNMPATTKDCLAQRLKAEATMDRLKKVLDTYATP